MDIWVSRICHLKLLIQTNSKKKQKKKTFGYHPHGFIYSLRRFSRDSTVIISVINRWCVCDMTFTQHLKISLLVTSYIMSDLIFSILNCLKNDLTFTQHLKISLLVTSYIMSDLIFSILTCLKKALYNWRAWSMTLKCWIDSIGALTHLCLASHKMDIGKQCRPRSDVPKRGLWSGSLLLAAKEYWQTM